MGKNDGCSGGCLSFIAGLVLIGLVLLAIKWFGIPVGLALAVLGFLQFKRFDTDPDGFDKTAQSLGMQTEHLRWACIGSMVAGTILVIASVLLWLVPDDKPSESRATSASGPVPTAYRGTWAFAADCDNSSSRIEVSGDSVDFPGGVTFAVDRASGSDVKTVLYGDAMDGSRGLRDAEIQSDRMTLTLVDGGQTMVMDTARSTVMNGARLKRC